MDCSERIFNILGIKNGLLWFELVLKLAFLSLNQLQKFVQPKYLYIKTSVIEYFVLFAFNNLSYLIIRRMQADYKKRRAIPE